MILDDVIGDSKLVVCLGGGGVGKTTVSAAIASRAAMQGRRALVMTIDPARRLADALGLDGLDDRFQEVDTGDAPGRLYAAMLDTKRSYDALLQRVCSTEEQWLEMKHNRIYGAFSRTTERAHAYIAMERLHEALHDDRFDLVVLDTPPSRNALEILDSPGRLARFLQSRGLNWLVRTRGFGGGPLAGLLDRALGGSLVGEIIAFLKLLFVLAPQFAQRAEVVERQLESDGTRFLIVTRPRAFTLATTSVFVEELRARGVEPSSVIFNRATESQAVQDAQPTVSVPDELEGISKSVFEAASRIQADNDRERSRAETWIRETGKIEGKRVLWVPESDKPPTSVQELSRLIYPNG